MANLARFADDGWRVRRPPRAAAAPAPAPAVAVSTPTPAAGSADPYAPIRRLRFFQQAEDSVLRYAQTGAWYLDPTQLDAFNASGFGSKYTNFVLDPAGYDGQPWRTISADIQQPGAHKYDTMRAVWLEDPLTGEWVLDRDPAMAPTRQRSSADSYKDAVEKFGLMAAFAVAGNALQAALADTAAAAVSTTAADGAIGVLGTLPEVAAPLAPIVDTVAVATLPALPELATLPALLPALEGAGAIGALGTLPEVAAPLTPIVDSVAAATLPALPALPALPTLAPVAAATASSWRTASAAARAASQAASAARSVGAFGRRAVAVPAAPGVASADGALGADTSAGTAAGAGVAQALPVLALVAAAVAAVVLLQPRT